jgi:rhodanese-related sulfurtransferase
MSFRRDLAARSLSFPACYESSVLTMASPAQSPCLNIRSALQLSPLDVSPPPRMARLQETPGSIRALSQKVDNIRVAPYGNSPVRKFQAFQFGMGSSSKKIKRVSVGKENEAAEGVVLATDEVFSAPGDCRDRAFSESGETPMTIRARLPMLEFPDKLSRMLLGAPDAAMSSTMCAENGWKHKLECTKYEMVDRISCDVVAQIIQGRGPAHLYSRVVIFDCRFPFEFEGGHLPGALNITGDDDAAAVKWLFGADDTTMMPNCDQLQAKHNLFTRPDVLLIFHCEFSQQRGPRLCRLLRDVDRKLNESRYPDLYYPEMYVMDGGYKQFFKQYPELCQGSYVPMLEKDKREECIAHEQHNRRSRRSSADYLRVLSSDVSFSASF